MENQNAIDAMVKACAANISDIVHIEAQARFDMDMEFELRREQIDRHLSEAKERAQAERLRNEEALRQLDELLAGLNAESALPTEETAPAVYHVEVRRINR